MGPRRSMALRRSWSGRYWVPRTSARMCLRPPVWLSIGCHDEAEAQPRPRIAPRRTAQTESRFESCRRRGSACTTRARERPPNGGQPTRGDGAGEASARRQGEEGAQGGERSCRGGERRAGFGGDGQSERPSGRRKQRRTPVMARAARCRPSSLCARVHRGPLLSGWRRGRTVHGRWGCAESKWSCRWWKSKCCVG
jgi:hypothetical protein